MPVIVPQKPRLVILSAFLSPHRYGAEAIAEELASRLTDRFSVFLITARLARSQPRHDFLDGRIPITRVGIGSRADKWLYPFLAPFAARRAKPDILHAILESFAGLALHFCKWLIPGVPRLLTSGTTSRHFMRKLVVRSPDSVVAVSSVMKGLAERAGRVDTNVIPGGVSLEQIHRIEEATERIAGRILYAGRLMAYKGVDTLLRAFAKLPEAEDTGSEIHLRIVGDGPERRAFSSLAHRLRIAGRVSFTGRVRHHVVLQELAAAQIFCGLSTCEALGIVFLEAQAAGCAVVASDVGGIRDIVKNGDTGLLVSPGDVDGAAAAIRELLSNESLRKELVGRGRNNAEAYDWSLVTDKYSRHYNRLLGNSGSEANS